MNAESIWMSDGENGQRVQWSGCAEPHYYTLQSFGEYAGGTGERERERASALKARDYKDATDLVVQEGVRRIMPIECCRLQGFPDIWDSVEGSDSAKFRMWGSGMALPCILYIMEGIVECEKERVKPNE